LCAKKVNRTGYVEGDGSAGIYRTVSTTYPKVSFVGTQQFINHCIQIIPVPGRCYVIKHAKNLADLVFCGRNALRFADWIWANPGLPHTRKEAIIQQFRAEHTPRYITYDRVRLQVRGYLEEGWKPEQIAEHLGIAFGTVYRWRKEFLAKAEAA
jgi:hypothetical protein